MSVHVTYDYDPADRAAAAATLRSFRRRDWIAPVVVVLISATAIGFLVPPAWHEGGLLDASFAALPYLLLAALWLSVIPVLGRREARRLLERDPSGAGVQERSVDAIGYHVHTNGTRIQLPWSAIVRCVETESSFLFYTDEKHAHFLPKRVLRPSDLRAVRALSRTALGERAQLPAG